MAGGLRGVSGGGDRHGSGGRLRVARRGRVDVAVRAADDNRREGPTAGASALWVARPAVPLPADGGRRRQGQSGFIEPGRIARIANQNLFFAACEH
uniref:Uncharacterized protein n=1 Tax=Setaria viridis TaxID=4556 RepID=A0A4U6WHS3_SETVI|nr:hypothetical protein SEVIR_1G387233v2 [Setaria viridis]